MFERISNGIELARQSLSILREDKKLLIFPLLSSVACGAVLLSFLVPLWFTPYADVIVEDHQVPQDPVAYALLFAFYFVNYFVIVFFNSALVSCAILRFRGGEPTVGDGLRAAASRLPQIAAWALLSATIGVILKAIESRSEKVGQVVAGLLGAAWSIATYFVVPIIVVEQVGPLDAVQRSFAILRRTWGESLVASFGIGFVVSLALLVAILPAVLGFALASSVSVAIGLAVTVLLVILVSLVSAALHTIIVAALYLYAAEHKVPAQFDEQLLRAAYAHK